MALTQIADVIVPSVFEPYKQQITETKSNLIASGALVRDPAIDELLAGAGLTFNAPSWKDAANDTDQVPDDDPTHVATLYKTGTSQEILVRLNRNQHWSSADLAAALAGADPQRSIADRVGYYWTRRLQAAFVATLKGVFADNAAAPGGSEHVEDDMAVDISGGAYVPGVTDFSAESFIDACATMGDSMEDLGMVMVHSVVYARMQKNNLIDFIPDSQGVVRIPTFLGRRVIVDDGMPVTANVYDSWLFGAGAVRLGVGTAKVPVETTREALQGYGGGVEILSNRIVWAVHPVGCKYAGTAPNGGPDNTANAQMLAAAASWMRVFPERKQIKIARLITREA
jgi:hypothetical protein